MVDRPLLHKVSKRGNMIRFVIRIKFGKSLQRICGKSLISSLGKLDCRGMQTKLGTLLMRKLFLHSVIALYELAVESFAYIE